MTLKEIKLLTKVITGENLVTFSNDTFTQKQEALQSLENIKFSLIDKVNIQIDYLTNVINETDTEIEEYKLEEELDLFEQIAKITKPVNH